MSRNTFGCALAVAAVTAMAGCASPARDEHSTMASSITFDDQWATSADMGMAAVFGTFTNGGDDDAVVVSGKSEAAAVVELHEVAPDAGGTMTMRPKEGGITIAAHGAKELVPGGDHLMLMELRQPLTPGADVDMTVTFADGSTLPITAQIRDFAGGNEEYSPDAHDHG
jgi:copper(I)-binding protein